VDRHAIFPALCASLGKERRHRATRCGQHARDDSDQRQAAEGGGAVKLTEVRANRLVPVLVPVRPSKAIENGRAQAKNVPA